MPQATNKRWWEDPSRWKRPEKSHSSNLLTLLGPSLLSTYFMLKKHKLNVLQEEVFALTKAVLASEGIKWAWNEIEKVFTCPKLNMRLRLNSDGSLLAKKGKERALIKSNNIVGGLLVFINK